MRVYPNGWGDVNNFQEAGGMPVFIRGLLQAGFLHNDVKTMVGEQLSDYCQIPELDKQTIKWVYNPHESSDLSVLVGADKPFSSTGGLVVLNGNLGRCIIKTSALGPDQLMIRAPAFVFHDQASVEAAFQRGDLNQDCICVVRFQGPQANGMPELHGLTPALSAVQAKGYKIALLTDGRMSGASGKIPAAIHISPEAQVGGPISKLRNGDIITIDATQGILTVEADNFSSRPAEINNSAENDMGCGRELFAHFRQRVSSVDEGACALFNDND
jgi:phosphogluconate dehydratase